MIALRFVLAFISIFTYLLFNTPAVQAESTDPFPPFSVEGNPDERYQFDAIFPLFRYVRPRALKIYENRERSRNYEPYQMCGGPNSDRRDDYCSIDAETGRLIDECTGGFVDICYKDTSDVAYQHESKSGSCTARRIRGTTTTGIIEGTCEYLKRPQITNDVKGTDFSAQSLAYPKYQNEAYAYSYVGNDNPISWGSLYLTSSACDIALRKVVVIRRASQTRITVDSTGEWPLGWVDWGYQVGIDHDLDPTTPTQGTKSLLEINRGLPDDIAGAAIGMIEQLDDMYMNPGNYALLEGIGESQVAICNAVTKEAVKNNPAEWYVDLMSAPMYPPSFRQGFIRPSICKWNLCCPGLRCPLPEELLIGTRRGLYYDISVSQSFGGALDQLFMTYPLQEAMTIFRNIASNNHLVRFASSASEQAIPTKIHEKLRAELKGTCYDYIPWGNFLAFGTHIDYLDSGNFLGPNDTCPDYELQPELTKDKGGAYPEAGLSWLLNLIWGETVDEAEPDIKHLITIPDAMGQSLKELQQGYYDTRDTLADLEAIKDFNDNLSATVDDDADLLYGGKTMSPADARRRFSGYLTCADPMFSNQLETSVEQYALGVRVGCDHTANSPSTANGQCSPEKFEAIIADSPWKSAPNNVTAMITNSAMFEGGVLNPKLEEVYAKVSEETGVPCEVLAGHHYEEATTCFTLGNPESCSVANGGAVGEQGGLEATALSAANGLLRHPINTTKKLITAISNFNGGGNSNCQIGFPGGTIPYGGCPREFQGEDDPYAVNLLSARHNNMFLLYCGDFTPCIPPKPYGNDRPGVFPVALVVHEYLKTRTPSTSPAPSTNTSTTPTTPTTGGTRGIFRPVTCGEGSLATALGCLPYSYQPFVTTLLRFIVGISGAISLVVMLIGVMRLMTSAGDPKMVQSGRDLFSAGIAGILFVVFSVALLRLIAADILRLPGF